MLGVTIGDKHTYHDLKLMLKRYPEITPPNPKKKFVDVPGADGALDLSRALTGFMLYDRRKISMDFNILAPRDQWPEIHAGVMDELHGLELSVILDDDPEYCYTGIISVKGFDPQKVVSGVTIEVDAEPYKTRIEPTRRTFVVNSRHTGSITGSRKPVCPLITASAAMQMTFGGAAYSIAKGENTFPDVILRAGVNTFTFTGDGTVAFEYREGRF